MLNRLGRDNNKIQPVRRDVTFLQIHALNKALVSGSNNRRCEMTDILIEI